MPKRIARFNELVAQSTLIERKLLSVERHLSTTKWFSYRFMSPLAATMEFARSYRQACKNYTRTNIDMDYVDRVRGVSLDVPSIGSREFTQLWRARQRADEVGLPYDRYLEFAMNFAGRKQRKRTPRPSQLHANRETAPAWWPEFEKFKAEWDWWDALSLESCPQLSVDNDSDLPAQIAVREHIRGVVGRYHRPWPGVLEVFSVDRQLMRPIDFESMMDPEMYRRVSESMPVVPKNSLKLDAEDFWQSCMGVPGAFDDTVDPCRYCPQSAKCQQLAALVDRAVTSKAGSADPRGDRRRARGRERVALCRQRQKERPAASSQPEAKTL